MATQVKTDSAVLPQKGLRENFSVRKKPGKRVSTTTLINISNVEMNSDKDQNIFSKVNDRLKQTSVHIFGGICEMP